MSITETTHESVGTAGQNGRFTDRAGKSVRQFADTVSQRLGAGSATELASDVDKRTRQAYAQVKTQVQQRPAVAVGIAAGAGLLIGLMMSARRH